MDLDAPEPVVPIAWHEKLLSRAEEWVYDLNERGHWIFGLYDWGNEVWARLAFGSVRRSAERLNVEIQGRDGVAQFRLLTPDDTEAFADLLGGFDFDYLPPHPLDRASAARALQRKSYLAFGIFQDGELFCYLLLRLFFPRRVVLGYSSKPSHQNRGFSTNAIVCAGEWSRSQRLDNYITVPLANTYSLRSTLRGGWRILRSNSRFHVLLYDPVPEERREAERPFQRPTPKP